MLSLYYRYPGAAQRDPMRLAAPERVANASQAQAGAGRRRGESRAVRALPSTAAALHRQGECRGTAELPGPCLVPGCGTKCRIDKTPRKTDQILSQ